MNRTKPYRAGNTDEPPDSTNGTAKPNNDDIRRLHDLILTHAVKGEMGQRVFEYLVGEKGTQERICAQDITEHGGPNGDHNVCPFMSRLRDQISDFFDFHRVGRKEPYRVAFSADDRGNYALHIEPNQPPNDLVAGF